MDLAPLEAKFIYSVYEPWEKKRIHLTRQSVGLLFAGARPSLQESSVRLSCQCTKLFWALMYLWAAIIIKIF